MQYGEAMQKRNIRRTGIPASKGGKPNPAYAALHDRRSTDLTRNAEVKPMEVDDPLALDPGDKIVVMRSTRNDPLAALHSRRQIDEAQYHGGRAFQYDFEKIEHGAKAIDPSQPYVDCSVVATGVSDAYSKALARLARAQRNLGADGSALVHGVLIHGHSYSQIAGQRGLVGERWEKYFGMRFRECLDCLAKAYGFSNGERREGA